MYEMKGALSGRAAPDPPAAWLPRHRAPPAGAKHPPEPPVSRLFPCPGVTPGWCPFPTVELFLLPSRWWRKSLREFILRFFSVHTLSTKSRRLSARHNGYPPAYAHLVHKFIHRLPDVTQRILRFLAARSRWVFSRRRSVNHPKLPSVPLAAVEKLGPDAGFALGNVPQGVAATHGRYYVPLLLGTVPHPCPSAPPAGRDQPGEVPADLRRHGPARGQPPSAWEDDLQRRTLAVIFTGLCPVAPHVTHASPVS